MVLGFCYFHGDGVEKSLSRAVKHFELASERVGVSDHMCPIICVRSCVLVNIHIHTRTHTER